MDIEFSDEEFNNFRKKYSNLLKSSRIKQCFFNDESCKLKKNGEVDIINAHSISKSSTLNLIKGTVSSNDKVIVLNDIEISKNGSVQKPTDKGWSNQASIFNGFCSDHDRETFKPIENGNPFDDTDEQCFLHSFRTFAFSYHKFKEIEQLAFNTVDFVDDSIKEPFDQLKRKLKEFSNILKPFGLNSINDLTQIITGKEKNVESLVQAFENKIGQKVPNDEREVLLENLSSSHHISKLLNSDFDNTNFDLLKLMTDLENQGQELSQLRTSKGLKTNIIYEPIRKNIIDIFHRKGFKELKYVVRTFRETYPVASADCFFPRFVADDDMFTYLPSFDNVNPCLMLTVVPDEFKRTIVILSCFQKDLNACYYLNKIGQLNDVKFRKAISGIMIHSCSTNTFLNPKMWDKICFNDEDKLIAKEIAKKRPFDKLNEEVYLSSFNFFQDKYVMTKESRDH